MIVVVERLSDDFIRTFWQFIKEGGYKCGKRKRENAEEPVYELYRFEDGKEGFPIKIELLSRHPDVLGEPSGFQIEPIPAGEDLSNLSAIIMDDDYYRLTLDHSTFDNGLHIADFKALVCLKAKAFLNLTADREAGIHRNTKDIKKHRSDVIKLTAGDPDPRSIVVGEKIAKDIQEFVAKVDVPEMREALKESIKVDDVLLDGYINILKNNYLPR
ncbi:MAG: hypothetical protein IJU13_03530 [Bacteroidales bacterium]|nr:hypothetical protein [Bacteroidales bacterium]